MEQLLDEAAARRDGDYLKAEAALRAAGAAATAALVQTHLHDPDLLRRLIVGVVNAWTGSAARDYDAALDLLRELPLRFERTPLGEPPPLGVANELSERFGARVAEMLALRLVKTQMPRWQALGVVLYLQQQRRVSTTDALLRYAAASAADAEASGLALDAVRAIGDPALANKLDALRQRLAASGGAWPPVLDALKP